MSVIYEQAERAVYQLAERIISDHHPHLVAQDGSQIVRLCILTAARSADDKSGEPAVSWHGYAAGAVVSVIPYKQRVDKRADAEIIIDAKWWDAATQRQRDALLDHEITHLELKKDKHGFVETDDEGRPKLKLRLHDWQLGGFHSIALRYGSAAPEVEMARDFDAKYGADVLEREDSLIG